MSSSFHKCLTTALLAIGIVLPASAETGLEALERLRKDSSIINVHEHIQGPGNVDELLEAMDAAGIQKTVLVGSSWFTLRLYERAGFTRYDENNEIILSIAKNHPDRFEAWPTLNPLDPRKLEKVRDLVARGASGVKLYTGHGYVTFYSNEYMFHPIALDDPQMLPVYEFLAKEHVPLCFHVNSDRPGFADEFVAVLTKYPDLVVNCPHWMLSSMKESRLREYLDTFPNLYSDISFGHDEYMISGLQRISFNPEKFRQLIRDYPTRFMFGTDFVYTDFDPRPPEWAVARIQTYYDMLARSEYTTPLIPGETLRGLELSADLLERVLTTNYQEFRKLQPSGTILQDKIDWSRMRVWRQDRAPGQALPPPPRSKSGY